MQWIGMEQILQGKMALGQGQIPGRSGGEVEKRSVRRAVHVILYLGDEGRNKIKGLVDAGKLVQQFNHSVIVFQCVQARPRQPVFSGNQVLVIRLVLMPQNDHAKNWHELSRSRNRISSLARADTLVRMARG